jgi:hypothetical protein
MDLSGSIFLTGFVGAVLIFGGVLVAVSLLFPVKNPPDGPEPLQH